MPRKLSVVEEARKEISEVVSKGGLFLDVADIIARAEAKKKASPKKAAKKAAKRQKIGSGSTPKQREKSAAKKLAKVAGGFAAFRHASVELEEVEAVPTIFVQFDHASGVGGWPTKRFSLVHGKSGEGKTLFVIGLMKSFLMQGHYADYVDAEATTPFKFVRTLMGEHADNPRFFATRGSTYEEIIVRVRNFCNALIAEKAAGRVPPETSGIIVVDSMRKLVPKDLMEQILRMMREEKEAESEEDRARGRKKTGQGGVTTGKDRRAQIQAKMNAAWMDEVIPLLARSGATMVAIAREMEDPDAHQATKKAGWGFKIGGGGALFYDSSLVVRVGRKGYVEEGGDKKPEAGDEFVKKKMYGEKHSVTIHKTKIAGREDKKVVSFFHSSNGVLVPAGYDRARDLVDMSERFEVGVEKSGSWFSFAGKRIGQGRDRAVANLARDPEMMAEVEAVLRSAFGEREAAEAEPVDFDSLESGEE